MHEACLGAVLVVGMWLYGIMFVIALKVLISDGVSQELEKVGKRIIDLWDLESDYYLHSFLRESDLCVIVLVSFFILFSNILYPSFVRLFFGFAFIWLWSIMFEFVHGIYG